MGTYDKARKQYKIGFYRYDGRLWVVYTRYGRFKYMHTNPFIAAWWAFKDISRWWGKGFGI